ncbi:MAG: ParB/RepB/Spo0J family partition protein [Candidatus Eisenbacteria bacterium]|uniref:ParB/RepB/Spo0J family partition protein n=1 Tax=Eiseniibacteriota bacterium TaxID=2212470 RepID=A0A538S9M9_UNCEI|nr:MAG: ParB/RepB/Spo0J family partition protein [Candidatus Eisenbacteria bacterium]
MARKALGRGLASLIPSAANREVAVTPELRAVEPRQGEIQHVTLDKIVRNPAQPRTQFDPNTIRDLATSIRERGVLQPVLLRPSAGAFQIVAGERRFLAAREAGLETIPAIVRQFTDREALLIALIENVQRENLNPMDEARAYYRLTMEYGLPHEEIGQRVGKDRSTVSNILRFNNLPAEIQAFLETGSISAGHARALLALTSEKAYAGSGYAPARGHRFDLHRLPLRRGARPPRECASILGSGSAIIARLEAEAHARRQ